MAKIENVISFVFEHEGYKSNDANDPGGLTIWGIASHVHPDEVKVMDTLSAEDAKVMATQIYKKDYWDALSCDEYEDDKFALAIFDSSVNCGVQQVQKWLMELGGEFTFEQFLMMRIQRYIDISNTNPKLKVFLLGWLNRVSDLWKWKG